MKFCIHCGHELKKGTKFCASCGAAIEELKKEIEEEPVNNYEPKQNYNYKPPKKRSVGKIIFLSFIIAAEIAAIVVLSILLFNKYNSSDEDKEEETSNYSEKVKDDNKKDNDNKKDDDNKKKDNKYVGVWERNLVLDKDGQPHKRILSQFNFKNDGTFTYEDIEKGGETTFETKGTYEVVNNKIYINYEIDGVSNTTSLIIDDGKLCIETENCIDYFVKYGEDSLIHIDEDVYYGNTDDDDNVVDKQNSTIPYITADEYKENLLNRKDMIVVVTKEGCTFCEQYAPVVEKIAKNYKTPVYYYEWDDDDLSKFGIDIEGTPTTIIIVDGHRLMRVGYYSYEDIKEYLDTRDVK